MTIKVVAGDHFDRPIQLTKNDAPFSISPVAVVRARMLHLATGAMGDLITLDGTEVGSLNVASNWATSLVVPIFDSTITSSWTVGPSKMEIEVADPEPLTWFIEDFLVLPQTIT